MKKSGKPMPWEELESKSTAELAMLARQFTRRDGYCRSHALARKEIERDVQKSGIRLSAAAIDLIASSVVKAAKFTQNGIMRRQERVLSILENR